MPIISQELLTQVVKIAETAGQKIMAVYQRYGQDEKLALQTKADHSPLTEADLLAHQYIKQALHTLTPEIPLLSEESSELEIKNRHDWECFWCVDPLDGTKEFIHKTDEFTVNIALIKNHQAILGVINAPALDTSYYALEGFGAYKKQDNTQQQISATLPKTGETYKIIASRRHNNQQLEQFLTQLKAHTDYELVQAGSALKICLVAEGKAHIYPRFVPTSEWDTAAGQAILTNANGKLYGLDGREFTYNSRDSLLNKAFIASHRNLLIPFTTAQKA